MEHMETDKDQVRSARKRVWVAWIGAIIGFGRPRGYVYTADWGLTYLTGMDFLRQTRRNYYSVRAVESPGYFIIITGSEAPTLLVCAIFHKYVFYPKEKLDKVVNTHFMQEIHLLPMSTLIGHGYVQHAGAGWKRNQCIRFPVYFVGGVNRYHILQDGGG